MPLNDSHTYDVAPAVGRRSDGEVLLTLKANYERITIYDDRCSLPGRSDCAKSLIHLG